tara:strand:+ start:104 stop:289 length:186 start_codon:yes stop_codon:yes gene_type:complete
MSKKTNPENVEKIVIITTETYEREAHPYALETLDYIATAVSGPVEIEVMIMNKKHTTGGKS